MWLILSPLDHVLPPVECVRNAVCPKSSLTQDTALLSCKLVTYRGTFTLLLYFREGSISCRWNLFTISDLFGWKWAIILRELKVIWETQLFVASWSKEFWRFLKYCTTKDIWVEVTAEWVCTHHGQCRLYHTTSTPSKHREPAEQQKFSLQPIHHLPSTLTLPIPKDVSVTQVVSIFCFAGLIWNKSH